MLNLISIGAAYGVSSPSSSGAGARRSSASTERCPSSPTSPCSCSPSSSACPWTTRSSCCRGSKRRAGPGDDDAAREPQLVDPPVAGPPAAARGAGAAGARRCDPAAPTPPPAAPVALPPTRARRSARDRAAASPATATWSGTSIRPRRSRTQLRVLRSPSTVVVVSRVVPTRSASERVVREPHRSRRAVVRLRPSAAVRYLRTLPCLTLNRSSTGRVGDQPAGPGVSASRCGGRPKPRVPQDDPEGHVPREEQRAEHSPDAATTRARGDGHRRPRQEAATDEAEAATDDRRNHQVDDSPPL